MPDAFNAFLFIAGLIITAALFGYAVSLPIDEGQELGSLATAVIMRNANV